MADVLKSGGLVALPTETVYGLAGHAFDEKAVRQIFSVKGRPLIDPLIVHVLDVNMAHGIAKLNDRALRLAEVFWPGPLTMILPKRKEVPALVTAGLDTVAIRVPAHPVFRDILAFSGLPLAAPSANPFGYISPSCAEHVKNMLGERLEHVLDGGPCDHGVESTIVDLSSEVVRVLRPGPILSSQLEQVLGERVEAPKPQEQIDENKPQMAAGQLHRHYSPRTPAQMMEVFPESLDGVACVLLSHPAPELYDSIQQRGAQVFWLSESGAEAEMMQNLYAMLHRLDGLSFSQFYFERPAKSESSLALLDRLTRACAKS
jgi:L-threonylcarbamoyladenylate synthase